jgi:hypothetical protein
MREQHSHNSIYIQVDLEVMIETNAICRTLAGVKVIKVFEDWTSQTCRKCSQEQWKIHKDCSYARNVEKRMLIETLPSILLTGLWDTFPKGKCEHTHNSC